MDLCKLHIRYNVCSARNHRHDGTPVDSILDSAHPGNLLDISTPHDDSKRDKVRLFHKAIRGRNMDSHIGHLCTTMMTDSQSGYDSRRGTNHHHIRSPVFSKTCNFKIKNFTISTLIKKKNENLSNFSQTSPLDKRC